MTLAMRCRPEFDTKTRSRGESYFRQGRVRLQSCDEQGAEARVEGSGGRYQVEVDWSAIDDGELVASCTCPNFADGYLCKHLWATLLAVDARGVPALRSPTDQRPLTVTGDDEALPAAGFEDEESWTRGAGTRMSPERPPLWQRRATRNGKTADWRRQLRFGEPPPAPSSEDLLTATREREAWFVLDVGESFTRGGLALTLFQRERKQNGEFGAFKPAGLGSREIERFTHADDRELLALLLVNEDPQHRLSSYGYDSYYYSYQPKGVPRLLAPVAYDYVLPRLCAHERFVWLLSSDQPVEQGRRIVWDAGPPWRFRLKVDADDAQRRWTLSGQLVRPDAQPLPLDQPVLLLAGGVVLLDDRLARLDARPQFPWITVLRRDRTITVPYDDRAALLEHLWRQPQPPETELPENLRWPEVRVAPRGCVHVKPPRNSFGRNDRLYGVVSFEYDGHTVPLTGIAAGLVDAERERILVRDPAAERHLLAELTQAGARPHQDRYVAPDTDVAIAQRQLPQVVDRLVEAGWQVEAEGHRIRRPGTPKMSIASGVDWFDLSGEFDFDGVTAQLPDVLAALRKGEKYVRLGDGSHGLLPAEWLKQFGTLAELGQTDGKAVRFRTSQALLLDALLAAQPRIAIDRQFARFRDKLRTFTGIKPKSEPRGFTGQLREYQKVGLGWLHFLQEFGFGGCLADDMGLGKTVQVLALLESRRTRRPVEGRRASSLAVVPRSLVFNWLEEAARFTPRLRVLDYTGSARSAHHERLDEFDLIVTTYGTLRRDIARLKDVRFDYVVLDEAQAIKNAASQNAKACRLLSADHRLAMSGTPVENHLGELWSLFEFLNPGMLGRSSAFQALTKQSGTDGDSLALLARALAPFILRRTKQQVLAELPEKNEQTLHCQLGPRERRQYNQIRDFYRASLTQRIEEHGIEQSKIHVLEALLRLRQAACHPGLLDTKKADESSAKFDALLEQLASVVAEGHKALVFSQFTSLLGLLRRRLDAQGTVYEYLDGRTRRRAERVRRFQDDPDCRLFLISLKAGGHGLNLTAADYVFILDPWWNPAVEAQAIDRAHRIGQTRRVFAYRLIAQETVEEKIIELQRTKRELADAIISANDSLIRQLTPDDLKRLLT